ATRRADAEHIEAKQGITALLRMPGERLGLGAAPVGPQAVQEDDSRLFLVLRPAGFTRPRQNDQRSVGAPEFPRRSHRKRVRPQKIRPLLYYHAGEIFPIQFRIDYGAFYL